MSVAIPLGLLRRRAKLDFLAMTSNHLFPALSDPELVEGESKGKKVAKRKNMIISIIIIFILLAVGAIVLGVREDKRKK